jgi:transposase
MAGKTKSMSQIKQLILMHQAGEGIKNIARTLGMSKNTVKSYLLKFSMLSEPSKELLKLDDQVLQGRFHVGNPAYCDHRQKVLEGKLAHLSHELTRKGVTLRLLWEEYRSEYPDGYGYTQFCYHLGQYQKQKNPSAVLNHRPGEKLFVDFAGKTHHYTNPTTGKPVECQVFVATMPYSDYGFCLLVPSQKIADFLYALEECFLFLGGVPTILVTDNLKSAIIKSDRYEPEANQNLQDFANHYGTIISPTRVRKPKDKALVENHVKIFYTQIFARLRNRHHTSIEELNKDARQLFTAHNQTRMQQRPYSRQECFLSEEKPLLLPLPVEKFELKYYKRLTLAKNNFVFLTQDKHYYSAPYQYIGKVVDVISTRTQIKIYNDGQCIAIHMRATEDQPRYILQREHLCSAHQHYFDRSPDYYIKRAQSLSAVLGTLIEKKFSTPQPPETLYRSCDGILRLLRSLDRKTVDAVCQKALNDEKLSMKHLELIINNKTWLLSDDQPTTPLPVHKNIRGKDYFQSQLPLH